MSSPSNLDLDLDQSVSVAVEWECNNEAHRIAEPDPRTHDITFKIRSCSETSRALFTLYFPLYLKGVSNLVYICLIIEPTSLDSLAYITNPTIPDAAVKKKLNCNTVRLSFQLKPKQTFTVIAPVSVNEPLAPTRTQSGKVLDAVRMLSGATSCGVYIDASKLPTSTLQAISNAVNQGHFKSLPYQDDLSSMFSGTGGKVVQLSLQHQDAPPPSYNEAESLLAPNKRKRVESKSQDEPPDHIAIMVAAIKALQNDFNAIKSENSQLRNRVSELEAQVLELKGNALESHNSSEQRVSAVEKALGEFQCKSEQRLSAVDEAIENLQGDNHAAGDKLELFEAELAELDERQEELEKKVDAFDDGDTRYALKREILDHIASRLTYE